MYNDYRQKIIYVHLLLILLYNVFVDSQQTKRSLNNCLMLEHRLRRWPSTKQTLIQRTLFDGFTQSETMLNQCWIKVGPPSATLGQHQISIGSPYQVRWVHTTCKRW